MGLRRGVAWGIGGPMEMMTYEVSAAEEGAITVAKERAQHLGQNLNIEAD